MDLDHMETLDCHAVIQQSQRARGVAADVAAGHRSVYKPTNAGGEGGVHLMPAWKLFIRHVRESYGCGKVVVTDVDVTNAVAAAQKS